MTVAAAGPVRTGVILAAGQGSRMGRLGEMLPKPLLPVCNEPLIHHHVRMLREAGIVEIFVVVGHHGRAVADALTGAAGEGVAIRCVEQPHRLGIAHAVGRLDGLIEGPFALVLGDIAYDARLADMIEAFGDGVGCVLAAKHEPDPAAIRKNFSILLAPDGDVSRVIEKPRDPPNDLKGCGLYVFAPEIFDAIRRTPRTAARDEYEITESIQILIDMGVRARVATVVDWDMNLTVPRDLLVANLHAKRRLTVDVLLGEGCRLHPEARLADCIVGAGAEVDGPRDLRRSVLMPHSRLGVGEPLDGALVYDGEIIARL